MPEEKKIIIDEDWKSQVQAEKEAAKQKGAESLSASSDAASAVGAAGIPEDAPMPPASLELLVSSLVTEALIALGQIPHPATGQVQPRKHQAKYLIDTIDVLREKTKGNVTKDEEQLFEQLLHQLRMAFIGLSSPAPADAPPPS